MDRYFNCAAGPALVERREQVTSHRRHTIVQRTSAASGRNSRKFHSKLPVVPILSSDLMVAQHERGQVLAAAVSSKRQILDA